MTTTPYPWPRRPPKDAVCDAMPGVPTYGPGADAIVLHRCIKPATETCWWGHEAWLCEEHAEQLEAHGKVQRNPRRKRGRGVSLS